MAVLDPLLAAIKTAIEGASIAVEGVNLFWDRMPDLPVEVICFTRYSGRPGERIAELTGIAYDYPRVQLSVRGVDPEVVYNKAQAAYVAVSQYRGTAIQVFTPQSAVGLVMYDGNNLAYYGTNFEAFRRN